MKIKLFITTFSTLLVIAFLITLLNMFNICLPRIIYFLLTNIVLFITNYTSIKKHLNLKETGLISLSYILIMFFFSILLKVKINIDLLIFLIIIAINITLAIRLKSIKYYKE